MTNADPRAALLRLSQERGISLSALSGFLGRNTSYLQQYVRKGSPRKLEENDRRKLAVFFGVNEEVLRSSEEISLTFASSRDAGGFVDIPRLAVGASAGPGAIAPAEAPVESLRFSARWLRSQGLDPAMLNAITVTGDSMEPLLRDGDEILVDLTPRNLRDGVHVVRTGDLVMVKRVQTGIPGKIVLESENPAYRTIELPQDEVRIIGRVVWKGGKL